MKKLLLAALTITFGLQFGYAQKSVQMELPNRLFTQGKEMFLDNNYVGCIHTLNEFKGQATDPKLIQEADYMLVSSSFYRGEWNAGERLKNYLKKHPETFHRDQLSFFIGTTYFDKNDWSNARSWFSEVDMDYLSQNEQEDCSYRTAYANLQGGFRPEAKRLFGLLSHNSEKYAEPASYYLAYINFQEGQYDLALPTFRKLKNKFEYKENATFFLIQSTFLKGDLAETIAEGQDYIKSYPKSKNTAEVYRLLGNSNYRQGNIQDAIYNYDNYLQNTSQPIREDMYQFGEACYQTKNYPKAIEVLKNVASTTDQLGQAGQMLLGQSYQKVGDRQNAIMAFDAVARTKYDSRISEEALYNYVMMMNLESTDSFGQSIVASQRFLDEYPKSKYTDDVNGALAATFLSSKNYNAALNAINSMKSPGKQILDAKQTILFQMGTQKFIDGEYDAAQKDFNSVISLGNYNTEVRNESFFWRGEIAYHNADYISAAQDYTSYIAQASLTQTNYALALYNLGYTNFKQKEYNKALANFKKYISTEKNKGLPNYTDALNRIGDCYLFNRNFSEAESFYAQAANANPQAADYAEFQKAFVLGLQRNYNGKVAALNNMMAKYPNSQYYDDALYEKSRALVMLNKDEEAIPVLEKLRKEYPKSALMPMSEVQLGQLYFNSNNSPKAIEAYKRVISNYPNSEEARASIQSLEGIYKDMNDISSYAAYVNSLGGNNIVSASRQDSLTYLAAENVYMKGRKDESKVAFDKYLKAYPRGVFASDAHFYQGLMAFDEKDQVKALSNFNEVINSSNPKYLNESLIRASEILFDRKNYDLAYSAYDQLNQVASGNETKDIARLGMLRCAYLLKKDNDVVLAANKLLEGTKTSPNIITEARFYRGQSLNNLGKTDAAITDLLEVGKDTRGTFGAQSQYLLAEIYYKSKSYDKAIKQAQSFMKQGTPHAYWMARSIIVLSDAYLAKGDKFQARQYIESLQANYKGGEADIKEMITQRLAALNK